MTLSGRSLARPSSKLPWVVVGIGTALAAGVAAWLLLRPVPPVTVIVKNTSRQTIASVRLEHELGVEVLEDLGRGETKPMRFNAGGETSYRLRVRFADGSELAGGGEYAEAGDEFTETIGDSAIETEVRLPRGY